MQTFERQPPSQVPLEKRPGTHNPFTNSRGRLPPSVHVPIKVGAGIGQAVTAGNVEIDFGRREAEAAARLQHRENHRQPAALQIKHADVRRNVAELVNAVPVGGHVVVATPNFIRETDLTRYFKLVNRDGRVLIQTVARPASRALMPESGMRSGWSCCSM